jgi:predicted esterase
MTREDRSREIGDYVGYLDRLVDTLLAQPERPRGPVKPAPTLTVLGFSQGVATGARWTVLGRTRPSRLVLWGDFLPADLDLSEARRAWEATDVVLVRGDRDGLFADPALERAESRRREEAGLRARVLAYEGGHEIDPRVLGRIAAGE